MAEEAEVDDQRDRECVLSLINDFRHTGTVVSTLHASNCHIHSWQ